jgi:ketosteroid isomerase-like protein
MGDDTMTKVYAAGAALALTAGLLGACSGAQPAKPAVDVGKITEAVKADANQMIADFNAHDAAKAVSHDDPGIVGMFHGFPNTVGPDADLTNTKQLFADNPNAKITLANESVDVAASGDMAVFHSTYTYDYTDPKTKKPGSESGNFLIGYKPQPDGSWKIAWNIGADTPPAAAPPPKG